MTQQNLLELAKQGDVTAIASLINRQLQPKNITAKVTLKNSCLQVLLQSAQVPNQQALVAFIYKGITGLGAISIERVKVYALQIGEEFPAWSEEFEIVTQQSSVAKLEKSIETSIQIQATKFSLKERAKQGNIDAITKILNSALQHKSITVKANLKESCLQVMLESEQCPEQSLAMLIRKELILLNLEFIKTLKIFAKQTGYDIPDWTQEFDLSAQNTQNDLKTSRSKSISNNQSLTISLNGTTVSLSNLETFLGKILGTLGAIILFTGVFAPIISVPISGSFNYFYNGKGDGVILIIIAIISLVMTLKEKFKFLWWTGIASLGVLTIGFINFQMRISQLESQMGEKLAGNMFRGIADIAVQSIQLQWGWAILILGTGLILAAAAVPEKENITSSGYAKYFFNLFSIKQSQKAYVFLGLVLISLIVPKIFVEIRNQLRYNSELEKSKQLEGRSYAGIINNGQQLFYLESGKFATTLEELKMSISSETSSYKYEIVNADSSQAIATATPKEDRLKSYTGVVFIGKDSGGSDTTIAGLCESNTPSKKPPVTPQIVGNEIQCPTDSSKI